jgi:hypothetical protein
LKRDCLSTPGTHRSLLSEKREPEISNHIHEGSAEKEFGGETDNTEGNDDDENKKDNRTEFCHGLDHSSGSIDSYASTHVWLPPAAGKDRPGLPTSII